MEWAEPAAHRKGPTQGFQGPPRATVTALEVPCLLSCTPDWQTLMCPLEETPGSLSALRVPPGF